MDMHDLRNPVKVLRFDCCLVNTPVGFKYSELKLFKLLCTQSTNRNTFA